MIRALRCGLLFCFITLLIIPHYGQTPADYTTRIDSLIQSSHPRPFNGVILITQQGQIKYSQAQGYADAERKVPLTLSDNFRIQSNSKQVTAVLVLRAVEQGLINLNVPIRKYLPDFAQSWADSVTVHHLLNNTSGVIAIDKPLAFKPGSDYYYSNPGYGLIRPILEKVTGKTFIELANRLFQELQMENSYCYEMNKPNAGLVNGYWISPNTIKPFDFKSLPFTMASWSDFIPAGGMISNVMDLNRWDQALHHGKVLRPESYRLMTHYAITAQHDSFGQEKIGYGYGLRISDQTPIKYLGHSGKGLGFTSMKFYIPEKAVDVIVLQNVYDEDSKLHYYYESKIREIVLSSSLIK